MTRALLAVISFTAVLYVPARSQQPQQRFDLTHLTKLVALANPELSPDGRKVALVVSRQNLEDNRNDTELTLVDVATGARDVLVRDKYDVGQLGWSPSGGQIAFLAKPDTAREAKAQLFVVALADSGLRRLTNAPRGVQHFAWQPGGTAIAYATEDAPPKGEGEERHNQSFEVLENDMFLVAAPQPVHIWLASLQTGEPRRLTSGTWSLPTTLPPGPPSSRLAWSPDGRTIAFARQVRSHSGVRDSTSIQLLDLATGRITPLTGRAIFESMPVFSPDGRMVAYRLPRDGDPANVQEIYLSPASGGPGRSLTRALDRNLFLNRWLPDGRGILVAGNDATGTGLWIQPLEGAARRLELGELVLTGAFNHDPVIAANGTIAFTATAPHRPAELYVMASATTPPRRLTDFNAPVAALSLGQVERVQWKGADGWEQDGVLTFPPDFRPTARYPLVLLIHGGPRSASKTGFSPQAQLMAAKGWLVFQPNFRGSDNLGNAFQRANWADWGPGPGRDVMSGLAELKRRGYVDGRRIAVTGWSYGGYMSSWLAGKYPKEWRVVVAGAAATDLEDQYNLGDVNIANRYRGFGSPWVGNRIRFYREQSPITYATKIRAPTLILSNVQDFRVPITQSYKLFRALRDNGVESRFFAYPGRMHFPQDPVHGRDVFRRWMDWIDQHFQSDGVTAERDAPGT